MSTAQSFVETMKKLIAREVAPLLPSWRWGQVVATEPVTIELDAEQGTLSEIGSLVSGLAIGDRVQVLTWGTRSTITGIAGGGYRSVSVPITNTTDFEPFASASPPTVSREGSWVEFDATYRAKKESIFPVAENSLIIGVIPENYRPRSKKIFVCQGSGSERWTLAVYPTGEFYGSRYSGTQGVGAWLPVCVGWFAA